MYATLLHVHIQVKLTKILKNTSGLSILKRAVIALLDVMCWILLMTSGLEQVLENAYTVVSMTYIGTF